VSVANSAVSLFKGFLWTRKLRELKATGFWFTKTQLAPYAKVTTEIAIFSAGNQALRPRIVIK
jgi:hypothetical protein